MTRLPPATVDLDVGSSRDSARLAAALRAIQHEIDALLTAHATHLEVRDAYVLGRAVEGLTLTARLHPPAAVLESGLRRLVRSIPLGFMTPVLERALQEAIALCLDPLPGAGPSAATEPSRWTATRALTPFVIGGVAIVLAGNAVLPA